MLLFQLVLQVGHRIQLLQAQQLLGMEMLVMVYGLLETTGQEVVCLMQMIML